MNPPDSEPNSEGTGHSSPRRSGLRGSGRTRRLLRELHARTGELELLISGAVAFLLFLVPGRIDDLYYPLTAQLAGPADMVAFFAFYYLKLIIYVLILTFGMHLMVRAFWVAMVGLDSVYPRGIRWEKLRNGPTTLQVFRQMMPSTRELIVYSDGVASVTFAAGFSLVGIFLVSVIGAVALSVLGVLIVALIPGVSVTTKAAGTIAIATALLLTAPLMIDGLVGRFLFPDGPVGTAGRWMERLVATSVRVSGFEIYGPIQLTLTSQVGRWRYSIGIFVIISVVLGWFVFNDGLTNSGRGVLNFDPYRPAWTGEFGVDPRHYEDRDNPEKRFQLVPTLPTDVFDEETPFARLFVPIDPERDPEAVARMCPGQPLLSEVGVVRIRRQGVAPPDSARAGVEGALRCLADLWDVRVDDTPLDSDPLFHDQTETGLRGIAWMIDLRSLSPGQHLVEVARAEGVDQDPDNPDSDAEEEGRPPWIYRIVFWN